MFYYYGRKKKIAHLYPDPIHDSIVEPFAGSAAYSLYGNNWERDVYLFDIDLTIINVWKYLQQASEKDIRSLPDSGEGHAELTKPEKDLIGFHYSPGSSIPKKSCTGFNRWGPGKSYIIENLYKIKHWSINQASYKAISPNGKSTWFVDPPYESGGKHYRFGSINYQHLSDWVKTLSGQVIVCEREEASWLDFKPLTKHAGIGKRSTVEGVYYLKENICV